VGTPIDDLHWNAILRSASAFEMYRKVHGKVSPRRIVQFLVLDSEFPRSVRFCLFDAETSLHAISGTPVRSFQNPAERLIGQLVSELDYTDQDAILQAGLHQTLDSLQAKMNDVGNAVIETFFSTKPLSNGSGQNFRAVQ
jgi:uncharacterized alpha-E superfamily protein